MYNINTQEENIRSVKRWDACNAIGTFTLASTPRRAGPMWCRVGGRAFFYSRVVVVISMYVILSKVELVA